MSEQPATPEPDDAYETRRDAVSQDQSEAAYDADYADAATGPSQPDVRSRADLLPEEVQAGSADPEEQARIILEDSLMRTEVPGAAPDSHLEHRRSEDTV